MSCGLANKGSVKQDFNGCFIDLMPMNSKFVFYQTFKSLFLFLTLTDDSKDHEVVLLLMVLPKRVHL